MNKSRFRRVSLRLVLFLVMPLCAIGFWIGSRAMHANRQVAIIRSLEDQQISSGFYDFGPDVWWEAFWGGDPLADIEYACVSGYEEEFEAIEALTNLKRLDLNRPVSTLTATMIREVIEQHPNLECVGVLGTLDESVWREISGIPKLTRIEISEDANITDEVFENFADRPLTSLLLRDCSSLTDEVCTSIAKMTQLDLLWLPSLSISDQAMARLENLTSLERLDINNTSVTGAGLAVLANMPRLKHLNVSHCPLREEAFDHIAKLRQLRMLDLDGTAISDDQLGKFTHMTELTTLSLKGTKITDHAVLHIRRFPLLQTLDLSYTRVSDTGISRLSGLKDLMVLTCVATYASADCLNQVGDEITHDRPDDGLMIDWQGAACIDADNGQLHSYLPWYSSVLSNEHVAGWASQTGSVVVHNIHNRPLLSLDAAPRPECMAFSPSGDRLMTLSEGKLVIYEVPSGRRVRELHTGLSTPTMMMVLRDRLVTFYRGSVSTWHLNSGRKHSFNATNVSRDINAVVRDGRLAFWDLQEIGVLSSFASSVWLKKFGFDRSTTVLKFPFVHSIGFADDGRIMVAQLGSQDAPLEIRDLLANQTIVQIPVTPYAVTMSADAKRIATATLGEPAVTIWNAHSGQEIGRVNVNIERDRMIFTPDGRYLIVDLRPDSIDPAYR